MIKYYGHRSKNGFGEISFTHVSTSKFKTELHGGGKAIELKIRTCKEGEESKYWGWYDINTDKYSMIYSYKLLVQMCSPDFFEGAIKRLEGNIVNIIIEEKK